MSTATPHEPSTLIVGAGVFGASTAWHLSQQAGCDPTRITVVDRTPFPPAPAASTDINKIVRADYSSAMYCALAYEAMDAWATWPALAPHYHRTGWVMLDRRGSDLAARIRAVFRARGHDPTVDVGLDEVVGPGWKKGCLRGTQTEGFATAYWNPEAGWCDAAAATGAVMEAAVENGVKYAVGCVEELLLEGTRVRGVRLGSGEEITADRVVLATGAWTSSLMSPVEDALGIEEAERVEKQATAAGVGVVHYRMSEEEMEALAEMPVVVYGDRGEVIPPPRQNRLLKYTNATTFTNTIATSSGHRISVPPNQDQYEVSDELKRETEALMTSQVMPTFSQNKRAEYWRICWDARTPTQDWLLCRHPHSQLSNLFLAVGGSFHSYKFLPTCGKYMVNVLNGTGNGDEKDRAWNWKRGDVQWPGAHEKTEPKREMRDIGRS